MSYLKMKVKNTFFLASLWGRKYVIIKAQIGRLFHDFV
jgi:hypothetical protein